MRSFQCSLPITRSTLALHLRLRAFHLRLLALSAAVSSNALKEQRCVSGLGEARATEASAPWPGWVPAASHNPDQVEMRDEELVVKGKLQNRVSLVTALITFRDRNYLRWP